ncbi:PAAR domain-containing protein [Pseudomonas siliginis]|nr:PAAR domain-containing protein [Pseudomonas siliginis]UST89666.1 PAAR domain-containing protein [Pseudomonas siliginis]
MSSGRKLGSKGGPTSTGGVILEGNENLNIEGRIIASIGQLASCPVCGPGKGPIVAVGERTLILPAGPAALEGDYVACGCPPMTNKLLTQQHSGFAGIGRPAPIDMGPPIAALTSYRYLQVIIERLDDTEKPGLAYKLKDKAKVAVLQDSTCNLTGEGCEHPVKNASDYDTLLVGEDSEWTFYAYEEPLTQDLS